MAALSLSVSGSELQAIARFSYTCSIVLMPLRTTDTSG